MGRSPCCDKNKVKRGTWSPEEDATLKNYLHKHGTGGNWITLPQKAGLRRCGKSCRLRWLNYLRPDINHGAFTQEEEIVICTLYNRIGSRWSVIASQLPGRTDNDVKNYWNTKLKKKLMASDNNSPTISNIENATVASLAATFIDKTSIFKASTNSQNFSDQPFITANYTTGIVNDNSINVSYDSINFNFPRLFFEGSSNFSSDYNSCNFPLSNQDSSPFRPFAFGVDEIYGANKISIDEYSCEVTSGIWSQTEALRDDNADLYSIFHADSN